MPRNRPKKGKPYDEENLKKAIAEIEKLTEENKKFSKRAIARQYNINKDVLSKHLKGEATGVAGRPTVIAIAEEQELAASLKTMSKWGFALLKEEIKDVIKEYVIENKIKNPFKDNRPGDDWFAAFKERHNLTIKKPEALEVTRRTITSDPFIIYEFYELLSKEIERLGLENKPNQIYNLDESGFHMDPAKTKVVTEKGQPAHRTIQGSGRENTTVLACVNAEGKAMPPLVIFEANKFWSTWIGDESQGMIKGTFFGVSPTGWMTSTVFHEWFVLFTKSVKERPILLLFDGHLSHLDIKTIEEARSNNITILKFPPHTTDLLQPLDRAVFGPLKTAWDKEIHVYQREHQQKLSKADFVNVLGKVWLTGLSKQNIVSGFSKTGVYPVDKNKYPPERFDPAKLRRYNETHADLAHVDLTNTQIAASSQQSQDIPAKPSASIDTPSTSHDTTSTSMAIPLTSLSTPGTSSAGLLAPITPKRSFEELLLQKVSPKQMKPKEKRRKVDTKAVVITSDSYAEQIKKQDDVKKKEIEKKEKRRKAREQKKQEKEVIKNSNEKAKKKKPTFMKEINDDSSSEDDVGLEEKNLCQEMSDGSLHFSSSSDEEDYVMKSTKFKVPSSIRQIQQHLQKVRDTLEIMQVYAVYFESSFYLGQIQKIFYQSEDETSQNITEVEMKYLKWCGDNKFKWPGKVEIELVKPMFIFHGPIKTESFDPFLVPIVEIRSLYQNIAKLREQIFTENVSKRDKDNN